MIHDGSKAATTQRPRTNRESAAVRAWDVTQPSEGKDRPTPAPAGMNPGDTALSEISQSRKDKLCAISLVRGPWRGRLVGTKGESFNGREFSVLKDGGSSRGRAAPRGP